MLDAGVGEENVATLFPFGGQTRGTGPEKGGPSSLEKHLTYIVKKHSRAEVRLRDLSPGERRLFSVADAKE